jgi:formylglycine-generating enzyme
MTTKRKVRLMLGAALALLCACNGKKPISAEPGGTGGSGQGGTGGGVESGSGGSGGSIVTERAQGPIIGPVAGACPTGLPGAKLVRIPAPDGTHYCMDQREVVRSEYAQFLAAKGNDTSGQPDECSWNDRYSPILYDPTDVDYGLPPGHCSEFVWDLEGYPNRPVVCVDFCDAFAYCAWAGKRLCGRRSFKTTAVDMLGEDELAQVAVSTENEWYNACSQGGKTKYPYGDTYEAGKCIDATWAGQKKDDPAALDVTDVSSSQCTGALAEFQNVFDLSGSVEEWINMCHGPSGSCLIQGGSTSELEPEKNLACNDFGLLWRGNTNSPGRVGFRCCADVNSVTVQP